MTTAYTAPQPAAPVVPSHSKLRPLGVTDVRITDGFWAERQKLNAISIIPHALKWENKLGWTTNFALAAAHENPTGRAGREFSDSEVYKLLEAMSWEVLRSGDEALEEQVRALAEVIAAAQAPDGYLNTHFGQDGQPGRYIDFEWGHELYCYGHLFQAAVARIRSGREDTLVQVALEAADHVCSVFGSDSLAAICGHPEVEVGLAELGRAAGRQDYIEQARLFIERRGHGLLGPIELGQDYFQDDMPVRSATVFRGHAVRAGYLAAGAADVAVETHDPDLLGAIERQYDRTIARRMYITGGVGSRHTGEAFGEDFELPPDRAYCETCAATASVMVSWRLLLQTGQEKYADLIERTLFNAIACSPSLTGDSFFYANPLQVRKPGSPPDLDQPCPRAESGSRAPWFTVSCCPPNLARLYASLSAYVATVDGDCVRIHQFAPGEISATMGNGSHVQLRVETGYPYDGCVGVTVVDADPSQDWTLALRVPAWADVELDGLTREGDLAVARDLKPGQTVSMRIGMEPRVIYPDSRIDAARGCVAVERGPLVMCLESVDLPDGVGVDNICVDPDAPVTVDGDGVLMTGYLVDRPERGWPYTPATLPAEKTLMSVPLIPYHRWANRGAATMRVWLPVVSPDR